MTTTAPLTLTAWLDRRVDYAEKALEATKQAAAEELNAGYTNTQSLNDAIQEIARANVTLELTQTLRSIASHDEIGGKALIERMGEVTTTRILNGPNDTWSGRGNDLRRVEFEALLNWSQRLRYLHVPEA